METVSEHKLQPANRKSAKDALRAAAKPTSDALQKLKEIIEDIGLEMHPIMSVENYNNGEEFKLKEGNCFGRLSELFVSERLLKQAGDYAISRTHDDALRFSMLSESGRPYHLIIVESDGIYSFENSLYPSATSVSRLVRKCIQSPMNVLSAILGTDVVLRRLVDPNLDDNDNYSLSGLFIGNNTLKKENLICRGNIADCYLGKLHTQDEDDRVVIKVMHQYSKNELNNICRELHISNLLQRFISVDSVLPVRAVQLYRAPYMMIYPFMNCGSYLDFAQQQGSRLTFAEKVEVAQTIARALADMHFLGLLHCDVGARNIFVKKAVVGRSDALGYPSPWCYKYYLGDFRESHIGKVKEVDPLRPINIRWLAPEVFKTKQLTTATDVFAWGITLYEIFTGNLPYFSLSSEEIRTRLIAGRRIRPETHDADIPRRVLRLMRRCWRTNVSERPSMDGVYLRLKAIRDHIILKHGCCSECDIPRSTGHNSG